MKILAVSSDYYLKQIKEYENELTIVERQYPKMFQALYGNYNK